MFARHLTQWRAVKTDAIGVPHGGRYGDIPRMERLLNRHGFKLCWQYWRKCFAIYEERDGLLTYHLPLQRGLGGDPISLTEKLIWTVCYCRERGAGTKSTVWATMRRMSEEYDRRVAKEMYDEANAQARQDAPEIMHRLGLKTRPTTIVVPKAGWPSQLPARRRRRRVRKRRQMRLQL